MFKYLRFTLLFTLLCGILHAQIWQFPGEAVEDLTRLSLEELFQKWNPEPLSDPEPSEPGEYVQYRHEALLYFFGPFADAEAAREARDTLDGIRDILIQRDPKFQTSQIDLHYRPGAPGSKPPETASPASTPESPLPPHEDPPSVPDESHASTSNPLAFWISTLIILTLSGWMLKKT